MSELIWLTIPHQLPPVAVWYEDKEKLVEGLHEHEVWEDLKTKRNTWQWLRTNLRISDITKSSKRLSRSKNARQFWVGRKEKRRASNERRRVGISNLTHPPALWLWFLVIVQAWCMIG
jgi:hypothetical protein